MTNKEFLNEFDILYNSISSNLAPSLNEYEKSVLLTRAQEELIKELVTGNNQLGKSFDKDEEVRNYLHSLIRVKQAAIKDINLEGNTPKYPDAKYRVPYSAMSTFKFENGKTVWEHFWYKTFVSLKNGDTNIPVTPITHDQVINILNNPFKKPSNRRALYIDTQDSFEIFSDCISNDTILTISYLIKPTPIVLTDLSKYDISIDGVNFELPCKMPSVLHYEILKRAVYLAMSVTGMVQAQASK